MIVIMLLCQKIIESESRTMAWIMNIFNLGLLFSHRVLKMSLEQNIILWDLFYKEIFNAAVKQDRCLFYLSQLFCKAGVSTGVIQYVNLATAAV